MTIYLNDTQKKFLEKLLELRTVNSEKALHFHKADLGNLFGLESAAVRVAIASTRACRLIDISFENGDEIGIFPYEAMIEEQLQINSHYIRRYKEYNAEDIKFSSQPILQSISEDTEEV